MRPLRPPPASSPGPQSYLLASGRQHKLLGFGGSGSDGREVGNKSRRLCSVVEEEWNGEGEVSGGVRQKGISKWRGRSDGSMGSLVGSIGTQTYWSRLDPPTGIIEGFNPV